MNTQSYTQKLTCGTRRLRAAGRSDARAGARALLLWASRLTPVALVSHGDDPVPDRQARLYEQAIERRIKGEPIQHIIGHTDFYGLRLKTDSRALIPRADSACVVDLALSHLSPQIPLTIADLGTGTGALLAALLTHRPAAKGIAVEISPDATRLAYENFTTLGLSNRVCLLNSDWNDWAGWPQADLIIANPPYISRTVIPTLDHDVYAYDPHLALDGGHDGLDAHRRIIMLAAKQMKPGALLVLETGFDQKDPVTELLKKAGFSALEYQKDLSGHDRAILAHMF